MRKALENFIDVDNLPNFLRVAKITYEGHIEHLQKLIDSGNLSDDTVITPRGADFMMRNYKELIEQVDEMFEAIEDWREANE